MKKYGLILIILLSLFTLVACDTWFASTHVIDAVAVDGLWGYEKLRSGAIRIWLEDDQIAGYCTSDPELAEKVMGLEGYTVKIHYETVGALDKEAWNASGCSRLSLGTESSTPIFRLTSIERFSGE